MTLDLEILEAIFTNEGNDLRSLTEQHAVLLVFLRHFGCVFCREALDDFSQIKGELDKRKVKLIFVHMAEEHHGDSYLENYGLKGEEHISDPDMTLYEYFGLQKGGFRELYGLKIWTRVIGIKHSSDLKTPLGNMKQMPGVFMIQNGRVVSSFIHKSAADRPDYLAIVDRTDAANSKD